MTRYTTDRAARRVLALAAALVLAACGKDREEGGGAAAAGGVPAGGVVTLWTDSTELFMEHPALVVGDTALVFAAHLTDLTDFAPLRSGKVTFRFAPRAGGRPVVVVQDEPKRPGICGPRPRFAAPGLYDLTILVESPQARDSIAVPNLRVYATAAEAPREEEGGDDGISFLKEQQWKTPGFRTAFAATGFVAGTFDATGVIEAAAGRHAEVTAPISGLVDAGGIAKSPAPGQRVARGQALAVLTPSLGEAGSAYAEARARLAEAEDEHARAKRLVEAEAAPARRLHEAEIRLRAAREALAGFGGAASGGRIVVRAPIGGAVARRTITPGSRVEAGAPLFTIVDPSVVWLTVNVPAAQASLVGPTSGAEFRLEGSDQRFTARRIVSVGSVIDPQSRTLPVIYEVLNPGNAIRVGSTARAQVRTGRRVSGVVIPSSAIIEEDGRPIAYVQPSGETFERRELVLGGREGDRVLVSSGIEAGERVVTGAAYQVRLASLSTAVPAHGHAH
ncbi:MAG TPA: efflux RND transporter periplasmic adaptor subunit [Gemmatimonadaceae bacterium]|nr:efflux RND transporter periplasmic adaptor subunit [Gemmatimonadaceae bacterium]